MTCVLTIGHSNHSLEHFLQLLQQHGITALADVRSRPASRFAPHFAKARLQAALAGAGIGYVFMGQELGGRPDDPGCYRDGQVDYARLAQRPAFAAGLERVVAGCTRHRIALLCAEKDPARCHRALLLAPALEERGLEVWHIHGDGHLESQPALAARLPPAPDPGLFDDA